MTVIARRALRAFAPVIAMIAIVTVALAVAATAIPRSVDGFLSDALRYDAAGATAISRDLTAQGDGSIPTGDGAGKGMSEGAAEIWGELDDNLEALRRAQPEPLRHTLGAAQFTVVTAPARASVSLPNSVSLGYDPRFFARVTMLEGSQPAVGPLTVPGDDPIEVMASAPVAEALGWSVGDVATLQLADSRRQTVRLSGIFEAKNSDDPYWEHTTSTLEPTFDKRDLPVDVTATVFANPVGIEAVGKPLSPFTLRSSFWYPVAARSLEASTAGDLTREVRKFSSVAQPVVGPGSGSLIFRSNLAGLLDDASARSSSSQAVLATILAGPIGLAIAIEVLVARLAAARLRVSLALLRARGASAAQRRLLVAVPALVVGALATAAGVGLALLVPGGALGASGAAAIAAVAVAPALLMTLVAAGPERAPSAVGAALAGPLRLVGEAVVVLAAAASVASALQRGDAQTTSGVDLVAAAVPLTLSLLGCLITLRLYPLLLRRSLASAQSSRGVAAFLGMARALRAGSGGLVPVLAVLIGVSVAVFSAVLSGTLATGTQSAAEVRVGADLSVDNLRLDPDRVEAIRDIDGVQAAAGVAIDPYHRLAPTDVSRFPVTLVLVDPAQLAAVQRGVPGALELPDLPASTDGKVTLGVSAAVDAISGGETDAVLDYRDVTLVGPPLTSTAFGTGENWVVADFSGADALNFPSPLLIDRVLVKLEQGASVASVRSAIVDLVGPDAVLRTPADVAAERAANPAVAGIRAATLLAILGAALLSAAALALTTVLDGRSRRTALGLLATLGLGRRQARRSVLWELAPLSVVGLVVGSALGAALSFVVLTTVDLRPFTAGIDQPAIALDPVLLGAVGGGFALVLVATVAAGAWQATRRPRSTASAETGWES